MEQNCRSCFYSEKDPDAGKIFCTNPVSKMLDRYVEWGNRCDAYKVNTPEFLRLRGVTRQSGR